MLCGLSRGPSRGPSIERDTREVHAQRSKYLATYVGDFPANNPTDVRIAMAWSQERAGEFGCGITVVAPTRHHFREHSILSALPSTIDQQTAKAPGLSAQPVVVACWPDEQTLDKIDSLVPLKALCVVPWIEEEIAPWRSARAAIDLLESEPVLSVAEISDPVVAAALRDLTRRVNPGSGTSDPMDRDAAIQMFRMLHRARYRIDPDEIITWAVANGWPPRDAAALARIGARELAGRSYRSRKTAWGENTLDSWRTGPKDR